MLLSLIYFFFFSLVISLCTGGKGFNSFYTFLWCHCCPPPPCIVPARAAVHKPVGTDGSRGRQRKLFCAADFFFFFFIKRPLLSSAHQRTVPAPTCDGRRGRAQTSTPGMFWQSTVMFTMAPLQVFLWWQKEAPRLCLSGGICQRSTAAAHVSAREASLPRCFKRAPKCRGTKPVPLTLQPPSPPLFFFQVTFFFSLINKGVKKEPVYYDCLRRGK